MSDSRADIDRLGEQFRQLCASQPNEGNRLSYAKTKFAEAMHFLRVNADVHQDRLKGDTQLARGPRR